MKSTAVVLMVLWLVIAASGCSDEVIPLCDKDHPCPRGMVCDPATNSCVSQEKDQGRPDQKGSDAAPDRGLDSRPDQAGDQTADLSVPETGTPDSGPGADGSPDSTINDALSDTVTPPVDGNKKALGATCATASQCVSGHCASGVCCDKACQGKCESCKLAGKAGSCIPLDLTPCGATTCTDGASASSSTSFTCKSGTCAGTQTSCGTYKCDTAKTGCLTSCAPGKGNCAAKHYCPGSTCVPRKPNGQACKAAGECLSGVCQDSVCCDTSCADDCQSCVLSGKKGTCSLKPKGTACSAPSSCTNSATTSEVVTRQCDGKVSWCQVIQSSCTPYKCTSAGTPRCISSCTKNDQCLAGICDRVYKPGTCPKLNDVCYMNATAGTGGNGSKAKPYPLFANCSSKILYRAVAPGTYVERVDFPGGLFAVIIALSAPASVTQGGKPTVKLRGPSQHEALRVLTTSSAYVSGVEFSHSFNNNPELVYVFGGTLVLHNCLLDGTAGGGTSKGGIIAKSTSTVAMTDCKVSNTAGYGLNLVDSDATLQLVDVNNNGSNGIMLQSSSGTHKLTLDQVTSSANAGNGVVVLGGVLDADRLITRGNTSTGMGLALLNAPGSTISNLLSVYNSGHGIQSNESSSTSNVVITNATIAFNSGKEVYVPVASKNTLKFRNSIIWDTSGTVADGGHYIYSDVASYLYPGTGNKSQDPKFEDPSKAKMDFRLKAGSPCINAGNPTPAWVTTKDLDGNPRQKGALDMGAYEKQ